MPGSSGFHPLGRRRLALGRFLRFERHYLLDQAGRLMVREVVHHPGAVVIAPVDRDDVLLLRQHRVAAGGPVLELPAGKRDRPGESPAEVAARECEEEIGYRPGRLTLLHQFYSSPGFTDEIAWLFLAEDLEPVEASPRGPEEEGAELVRVPVDEALALARSEPVADAKTLIGLYALNQRAATGS
ncbi:MAG: NUDIX hydrolase [Acidimicrobiia bacterium]